MSIDLAALKTELQTDPSGLGYAALLATGSNSGLVQLLNAVRATITIQVPFVRVFDAQKAVDPAEYLLLGLAQRDLWLAILTASGDVGLPADDPNIRAQMLAVWPPGATRSNLAALQTRRGSRAEQVLGASTFLTHIHIALALGS